MSSPQQIATEPKLVQPTRRWVHRTWVLISFFLVLIMAISLFIWWLPRKESFAIRWAGGKIMCGEDLELATDLFSSNWMSQRKWTADERLYWAQWFSWGRDDDAMTWLDVSKSHLNGGDLVRLKQFPALRHVRLHDRHLGPGLEDLQRHLRLSWFSVESPGEWHLAELIRLPHLRTLVLFKPKSGELGLRALNGLVHFSYLSICDCENSASVLQEIQGLTQLDELSFERCTRFSDDDLKFLLKFTKLNYLCLSECSPIGDAGLDHLSHLEKLETLDVAGSLVTLSDNGLQSLGKLKNLTTLLLSDNQFSPNQILPLQKLLPNCRIVVRPPQVTP